MANEQAVLTRILAATDGSERAEEAVGRAAQLASLTGASLDLVYVIDTNRPLGDAEIEPKADAALQKGEATASKTDVSVSTKVVAGEPAEALLQEAIDHAADLICVGPDIGLLGGTVHVGKVAAHVLRHAPCSVMVGREAGPSFPQRVLCGAAALAHKALGVTMGLEAEIAGALAPSTPAERHPVQPTSMWRRTICRMPPWR